MTAAAWVIEFPRDEGPTIQGDTADEVVELWRRAQWHSPDGASWREELVKRAYVWSGNIIDPTIPSDHLLWELDKAGLIKLTTNLTGGSK